MVTVDQLTLLSAPLINSEVEWRAQRCGTGSNKKRYAFVIPYLSRLEIIDNRLDGILGASNWQNTVEVHAAGVVSTISILVEDEHAEGGSRWLSRTDAAQFTDIESFKGGISDAFKRACTLWGIGHELHKVKEVGIFEQMIKDGYPPKDDGDYIALSAKKDNYGNEGWRGYCRAPTIEGWQKIQDDKVAKPTTKEKTKSAGAERPGGSVGTDTQIPPEDPKRQGDESPDFDSEPPIDDYDGIF